MVRRFALGAEGGYSVPVVPQDHLVEEEIILDGCHLTADVMKCAEPDISLLHDRQIEIKTT